MQGVGQNLNWKSLLRRYLLQNSISYIILITALLLGMLIGVCCFDRIGDEQQLQDFLGGFFDTLSHPETIVFSELFQKSVVQTVILAGLLFLSGFSLLGIASVPFVVWYKGFAAGFTAMVFFRLYGVRVVPFVLLGILPSAIVWVPFLLIGAQESMKTSTYLLECCCRPGRQKKSFRETLFHLCTVMSFCTAGLLLAGVIDVYAVPRLLGLISNLFL